jgi:hypothetical protein
MAGGDWKASRATVAAAEKILAARSHSPEEAVAVSIVAARLAAATGSKSEAERRLKDGAAEAARYGLKPYEIEARLALLDLAGRNAKPAERVALAAEADKWECRLLAERVRAQNR